MRGLSPRAFARIQGTYFPHEVTIEYQNGETNRKPNWVSLGTFNGRHLRVSRTTPGPNGVAQSYDSLVIVPIPEPIEGHPSRNQRYRLTVSERKVSRDMAALESPPDPGPVKSTTYLEVVDFRVHQDVAGAELFWELRANHARASAG